MAPAMVSFCVSGECFWDVLFFVLSYAGRFVS
jgi:hypothetical protein